jgi:hypothetical protein
MNETRVAAYSRANAGLRDRSDSELRIPGLGGGGWGASCIAGRLAGMSRNAGGRVQSHPISEER